jgi:peptidase C39-like protein
MTRSADVNRPGEARPLTFVRGASAGPSSRLTLALLALVAAVGVASSNPVLAGQVTQDYAEAESVSCGPRVVFTLARQLGWDVTYETIRSRMHLTAEGATIQEVKKALNDIGIGCSARRLDLTELYSCPTPLIIHISLRSKGSSDGHYLIANEIGPEGVLTFDPYRVRHALRNWTSFSDVWTGYVIIPEPSSAAPATRFALAAALAVHLLALVGLVSSIRVAWRSLPARAGQSHDVARAVLLLVASGLLASPALGADEALRSHSNDGHNAAALLAGICGVPIAPGRAAGGEAVRTLDEVRSLLAAHGVASSVRRLTYDDLMHRTGPCILVLRFGKDDQGNFSVMISADSEYVTVAHAGAVAVTLIPVDEFRRRWGGLALLPIRDDSWAAYLAAAAGAVVIPALAYVVGRHGRRAAV